MNTTNPFVLFTTWFNEAKSNSQIADAAAMILATSDDGPSARIVSLKHHDEHGLVFYTNLNSRKAKDLINNPQACLCFYWQPMGRQIRIEGKVQQVTDKEADDYFASRTRDSQIGAWASKQSAILPNIQHIAERIAKLTQQFADKPIPRPDFWSGFRLIPHYFEFWQQGEFRLHKRIAYNKDTYGTWSNCYLYS